jgi:Protein of unknown function (DUF3307)
VRGQLLAHLTGDYLLQNDWMAVEKTSRSWPAAVHAVTYTAAFVPLTRHPARLAVIGGSHFVIDRWRLARYVVWARNQLSPASYRAPWADCRATGFPPGRPDWLTVWLMFIADNTLHGLINAAVLSTGQRRT